MLQKVSAYIIKDKILRIEKNKQWIASNVKSTLNMCY